MLVRAAGKHRPLLHITPLHGSVRPIQSFLVPRLDAAMVEQAPVVAPHPAGPPSSSRPGSDGRILPRGGEAMALTVEATHPLPTTTRRELRPQEVAWRSDADSRRARFDTLLALVFAGFARRLTRRRPRAACGKRRHRFYSPPGSGSSGSSSRRERPCALHDGKQKRCAQAEHEHAADSL